MPNKAIADLVANRAVGRLEKRFFQGAHRSGDPQRLLDAVSADLPGYGITRVARVTGLDRIGIEVFMVTRPNGRGLSVTQGKGCTRAAAKLSGVMEAIEFWYGEHPDVALRLASPSETRSRLDLSRVPTRARRPITDRPIYWTEAIDLQSGAEVAVPFDLVHACFLASVLDPTSPFGVSTNGLASGANLAEALCHALCEVVERHGTACLARLSHDERAGRALDLASVDDPVAQDLLARFGAADIAVKVWDATPDIALPCYVAAIADRSDPLVPPGFGAGCHASRAVALARALCEAAQSRLTRISGARDDLVLSDFGDAAGIRARWLTGADVGDAAPAPTAFADAPDVASDCLLQDLWRIVDAIRASGRDQVLAVELASTPRFSVVRAIVPGVYGYDA